MEECWVQVEDRADDEWKEAARNQAPAKRPRRAAEDPEILRQIGITGPRFFAAKRARRKRQMSWHESTEKKRNTREGEATSGRKRRQGAEASAAQGGLELLRQNLP